MRLQFLAEVLERVRFFREADRLGPDMASTHWRLYFGSTMLRLCRKKFALFGVGAQFRPGAYAVACSKISIGRNVVVRPQTMLFADTRPGGAGISIEDDVLIGSAVHVYTVNHSFDDPTVPIYDQGHQPSQPVILRRGCWVGANVTILPGVEIGENSVVGAGSVVTKSIPPRSVAVGNPARVVRVIAATAPSVERRV